MFGLVSQRGVVRWVETRPPVKMRSVVELALTAASASGRDQEACHNRLNAVPVGGSGFSAG